MNDLIQSLIKSGAPLLGTVIGGPVGTLAGAAIGALAEALGTPATPEAVKAAIETQPGATAIVQRIEAEKGSTLNADLDAYLRDIQDARATNVRYIEAGSGIAWAPAILTAINFIGFYGVLILVIYKGLPDTGARELVSGMIGAVVGSYLASNNFFFGSSQGSANKDQILKQIATQAGTPTVGQMAGRVLDAAVKTAAKR